MKSSATHFFVALSIAIVASIGYGVWYTAVAHKSNEAAEVQKQIAGENENMSRIATARAALTEIANDEASVQNYFVGEERVVPFVNDLEALGRTEQATVSVLSIAKGAVSSPPVLLATLSLTGTFEAILRTIGAIEYAPYAVSVSALTLKNEAPNKWQANLHLTVGSIQAATATSTP